MVKVITTATNMMMVIVMTRVLTFSGANWENQATMGQETRRGISRRYEGNFSDRFLAKFEHKEPCFSETASAHCIWVRLLE